MTNNEKYKLVSKVVSTKICSSILMAKKLRFPHPYLFLAAYCGVGAPLKKSLLEILSTLSPRQNLKKNHEHSI